jgi:hypothetical protein
VIAYTRMFVRRVVLVAVVACGAANAPLRPPRPAMTAGEAPLVSTMEDMSEPAMVSLPDPSDEVWLRGSTHVHAKPSGDSTTPVADVVGWYEQHGYDFIVLTDHNQVSELDPNTSTEGRVELRGSGGLIVLAGIELTHNPSDCLPKGDDTGRCRIHMNMLGVTARPLGKLMDWPDRATHERVAKYQSALAQGAKLGGIAQVNHPQWYWGMTPEVLVEVARRGAKLVEIANVQFDKWNAGDKDHPSTEQLWDAALAQGAGLWAVASDDAHDYGVAGKYPAGGGWIVVRARRDPAAILESIARGRFYASTGVVLDRAEVVGDELVVEVGAGETGVAIDFIENGRIVDSVQGKSARRALPQTGYVRAVITRGDGKKAWVQPQRR